MNTDLTPATRAALMAMTPRGLVLHDGKWRTRGLPSVVISDDAVLRLVGKKLVHIVPPSVESALTRIERTSDGRSLTSRLLADARKTKPQAPLVPPLRPIKARAEA